MRRVHFIAPILVLAIAACDRTSTLAPEPTDQDLARFEDLMAGVTAAFSATDDETEATETAGGDSRSREGGQSLFEYFASEIPGFGGLYRSDRCTVTVVLTDMTQEQLAKRVVYAAVSPIHPCHRRVQVEVVEGRVTYDKHKEYFQAARQLLRIRGVLSVSVDFRENRILVVVASDAVAQTVERVLAELGIPEGAFVIRVAPSRPAGGRGS